MVGSMPKDSSSSNQKRKQLLGRLEEAMETHQEVQGEEREGWTQKI